jgi:hypothetical protein
MSKVKKIEIKVIPATVGNIFIKKHHYSGKVVPNSNLHFGCFLENKLHGVMSFGSSINKKGTINIVAGTAWNEFIELNRMAFDDYLPRNSESRCIAIAIRLIKKHAPHIKWIISFADGTQCGDGTIYRASGFVLVGISINKSLRINPQTGEQMHVIQAHHKKISAEFRKWKAMEGVQLKYIYLIDKNCKLTVPTIPFSKIKELGISMYKGKKCGDSLMVKQDCTNNQDGGSNPTPPLKEKEEHNEQTHSMVV